MKRRTVGDERKESSAPLPDEVAAMPKVTLLSGGTGRTAEQLLAAALAQFNGVEVEVHRAIRIREVSEALKHVQRVADEGGVIFHSLVDPHVRSAVEQEVRVRNVPCIDVLGPALSVLGDHLRAAPQGRPGLLYEIQREQLDRMDAVDFTLAHDDGQRLSGLGQADVVLVGASRTSKSVTCFYLASRGIRAANVPLIPGHRLPSELKRLSRKRVIGLTMNAAHLASIRRSRIERLSTQEVARYADQRSIQHELLEVRTAIAEHGWECLDVSYKATEEVAAQIIELIPRPRPRKTVTRKDRTSD